MLEREEEIAQRDVEMALDKDHFGPVTQMNGPVEVGLIDEHQGQCSERKHGE